MGGGEGRDGGRVVNGGRGDVGVVDWERGGTENRRRGVGEG